MVIPNFSFRNRKKYQTSKSSCSRVFDAFLLLNYVIYETIDGDQISCRIHELFFRNFFQKYTHWPSISREWIHNGPNNEYRKKTMPIDFLATLACLFLGCSSLFSLNSDNYLKLITLSKIRYDSPHTIWNPL